MAKVEPNELLSSISGKTHRSGKGYYYKTKSGRNYYRERDESYHQNRSPKQRWEGQSFAYAQQQILQNYSTPEGVALMEKEWKAAGKIGADGRQCETARSWKFNMLKHEWKAAHPFEA